MSFNKNLYLSWELTKTIHTTEDYKALPKNVREYKGLYLVPRGLCVDLFSRPRQSEWDKFYSFVRDEYPIQWFFRHWLFSHDNPVYTVYKRFEWKYRDFRYAFKNFVSPNFKRWRNSCKRHEWKDVSTLLEDSNFALVLDFWHEEVVDGNIDWTSTKHLKKLYKQLEACVEYIEITRPALFEEENEELHRASEKTGKLSYEQRYKKHIKVEEKINKLDTKFLTWIIDNRKFFWT